MADLLQRLRASVSLSGYHLSIQCSPCHTADEQPPPCCLTPCGPICGTKFTDHLQDVISQAQRQEEPVVFRCPSGLLGFAIQFEGTTNPCTLVVAGARDDSLDFYHIEKLAREAGSNPFDLLEYLHALPVASEQEVHQLAIQIQSLTSSPGTERQVSRHGLSQADCLRLIVAVSRSIDESMVRDEIFTLLQETVGLLFDIPTVAVATLNREAGNYTLASGWGAPIVPAYVSHDIIAQLCPDEGSRFSLREGPLKQLFPGLGAKMATCHPLAVTGELQGVLFFIDREFTADDYLLVELLTGRAVQRLAMLRQAEEYSQRNLLSRRLLSMINSLPLSDGQDLYDRILQVASELAGATSGSLMLLDERREYLRIRSAIGLSQPITQAITIRLGTGIAGTVAKTGQPLLVSDIEQDARVATINRPRFATKSFISLPLGTRVQVTGVLNLSDKKNRGIFTAEDLELLNPFVNHVAALVQRNSAQDQILLLERLCITDPLTELYNRRFLERRMQEEINRSMRTSLPLSVMLIDLDHFKCYNDLNGHVAGDAALKKVAGVLCTAVREMDVVTRYGGEEFCVLLPGTSKDEAMAVASRIRRDIEAEIFHGEEKLPLGRLTASIGISSHPEDGITAVALINTADIALYTAKAGGRNRIVIHTARQTPEGTKPVSTPLLTGPRTA